MVSRKQITSFQGRLRFPKPATRFGGFGWSAITAQMCLASSSFALAGGTLMLTNACARAENEVPVTSGLVLAPSRALIKQVVEAHAAEGFAGTVAVDQGGKLLYQGAFGLANDTTRERITYGTVFNIGSITKQLTSVAIKHLDHTGKLSLEDPVSKFFPEAPADKAGITIGQLLRNRSGLPDHHARDREVVTRQEALQKIFDAKLAFAPGTDALYSNSGYTLLAAIIEQASGRSYFEFIDMLLRKAGVSRTADYSDPRFDRMKVATGYLDRRDMGSPATWAGPSWSVIGNGEYLSTSEDLRNWTRALMHGRVIPKDQLWKIYGTSKLGRSLSPAGGGEGGNSTVSYYPDLDLTIIVMSNRIGWGGKDGDLPAESLRDELEKALADSAGPAVLQSSRPPATSTLGTK